MAIGRAWLYSSLLFVAGAGTACFGDQEYGMFPPTSLRWLFIVLGIFIMAVSSAWMHALTKTWTRDSSAVLLPTPNQTEPAGGSVKGFSLGDQSFSCGGSARATAEWNLMLPQRRGLRETVFPCSRMSAQHLDRPLTEDDLADETPLLQSGQTEGGWARHSAGEESPSLACSCH